LEVHTEETVKMGRELINKFYELSLKYAKSFNFPKMHMLCHLFDDVWNKGVTANYSTNPSEQMHGNLHHAY
ncbi:hypothetical protein BDV93DRAFT_420688, partial [Ceratobasidium sp. AG-I]